MTTEQTTQNMKRMSVFITPDMDEFITICSAEWGITRSEVFRMAIDEFMKTHHNISAKALLLWQVGEPRRQLAALNRSQSAVDTAVLLYQKTGMVDALDMIIENLAQCSWHYNVLDQAVQKALVARGYVPKP